LRRPCFSGSYDLSVGRFRAPAAESPTSAGGAGPPAYGCTPHESRALRVAARRPAAAPDSRASMQPDGRHKGRSGTCPASGGPAANGGIATESPHGWSRRAAFPRSAMHLDPLDRTSAPGRPSICARSAEHLRPVGRAFAPGRPSICAHWAEHLRPLGGTFAPTRAARLRDLLDRPLRPAPFARRLPRLDQGVLLQRLDRPSSSSPWSMTTTPWSRR
jgi:hypothetical protein